MNLYIFETIQPDHIFAVNADSIEDAIKLVDEVAGWTQRPPHGETIKLSIADRARILTLPIGTVFHRELREPHVMGG